MRPWLSLVLLLAAYLLFGRLLVAQLPALRAPLLEALNTRLPFDLESLHAPAQQQGERGANLEILLNLARQRIANVLDVDLLIEKIDRDLDTGIDTGLGETENLLGVNEVLAGGLDLVADEKQLKVGRCRRTESIQRRAGPAASRSWIHSR